MDIDPALADVTLVREALRTGFFREVRREARASQSEWGAAADCSESEISRAERGLLVPRNELAGRLARVLRSALTALDAGEPRKSFRILAALEMERLAEPEETG